MLDQRVIIKFWGFAQSVIETGYFTPDQKSVTDHQTPVLTLKPISYEEN